MNYIKLGLSVYNKAWLIEPQSALRMLSFFEQMKENSAAWSYQEANEVKANPKAFSFDGNKVITAPQSSFQMRDFAGFDGATVAVIPISGPLMKADFCGDLGTASIKQLVQMASNTPSVKTIVFPIDSPGGTVDGTSSLADAISSSSKRTISVVDNLMCSAAYWIGSSANEVYASNKTDIIGSIGTMASWYDNSEQMKAKGVVLREYYATESVDKNKIFNDASGGDGKALIEEHLDPMNDVFLQAVKTNRGNKLSASENVLTGKVYPSEAALKNGLIDGIKSYEDVLRMSLSGSTANVSYTQKNSKQNTMTSAEIKAQFPETHAEIVASGVAQELDRVGAFMAFNDVDPEGVKAGIESGKPLTQTQMAEFGRKAMNSQHLSDLQKDSAAPLKTEESVGQANADAAAKEAFDKEWKANLKKNMR